MTIAGFHGHLLEDYTSPVFLNGVEQFITSGFTSQPALSQYPDREVYKLVIGDQEVYLKRYHVTTFKQKLQTFFSAHKAQKSWRIAHILLRKGIATPRPAAVLTRRRSFLSEERLVITEGIPNGLSLRDFVRQGHRRSPLEKRRLIRSVAEFLARLHRCGVYHGDLTAGNMVLQQQEDTPLFNVYLLDLDSVRSTFWITSRRRIKNLDELGRNFLDLRVVSTTDRIRFLKAYLNAYPDERRTFRELFYDVFQRTRFRLQKHQQHFI